jgi:hypothetical protein
MELVRLNANNITTVGKARGNFGLVIYVLWENSVKGKWYGSVRCGGVGIRESEVWKGKDTGE